VLLVELYVLYINISELNRDSFIASNYKPNSLLIVAENRLYASNKQLKLKE
jgi:hypothetical protein